MSFKKYMKIIKNSNLAFYQLVNVPAFLLSLFVGFLVFVLLKNIFESLHIILIFVISFVSCLLIYKKLKTRDSIFLWKIVIYILFSLSSIIYDIFFGTVICLAGPNIADIIDIESLQQDLTQETSDFMAQKDLFMSKVEEVKKEHETITQGMIKINTEATYVGPVADDNLTDEQIRVEGGKVVQRTVEVRREAEDLLKKLEDIRNKDKQIASLTNTTYSNEDLYENIKNEIVRYTKAQWPIREKIIKLIENLNK